MPDWGHLNLKKSRTGVSNLCIPFMASRSCPFNCAFCSTKLYWGRRLRYRPLDHIMDEISYIYRKLGVRKFHCLDDNVGINKNWFMGFCERLKNLHSDIEIEFSNFSIKTIDSGLLQGLKSLGVKRLTVAVETGSPVMQKKIGKGLDLKDVQKKIRLIKKSGFQIHICWMIGFPGESIKEIQETVNMARRLNTESMQMYPVFPFPGTQMYNEAKAFNLINLDENDYESMSYQSAGKILSNEWDAETLSRIAYDANIELNFLNNPLYKSATGRKQLITFLKNLVQTIPDHVIAFIVMGFLEGKFLKNQIGRKRHYEKALSLLNDGAATFKRYMSWNFPQVIDFRKWCLEKNYEIIFGEG
jgi:radical SAM superfamily enzyme YgiQ (UPF0313 family)